MSEKTPDLRQGDLKFIPIEWPDADVAYYANNLVASCDGNATYLTFCQIPPPLVMAPSEEERRNQLSKITTLKAQPVARVVVPIDALRGMIQVLQQQLSASESIKRLHDTTSAS
jgi:2-methylisocitrate lyase-like PEP mutase family enzyme